MTRPVFHDITDQEGNEVKSFLDIEQMIHPCVTLTGKKNFIPNDTYLESQAQKLLLVTGPNMGGKSTLLR